METTSFTYKTGPCSDVLIIGGGLAGMYSALGRHADGTARRGEVVAAVYASQRGVGGGLHAVLYGHVSVAGQGGEVVELCLVNAVGACADDDARHVGVCERLVIEAAQIRERGVGVGEGLEIDQKTPCRAVSAAVELDALVDLLRDALCGGAV